MITPEYAVFPTASLECTKVCTLLVGRKILDVDDSGEYDSACTLYESKSMYDACLRPSCGVTVLTVSPYMFLTSLF